MSSGPKQETRGETFSALDIRKGTVVHAEINAGARKPAYRLWVDFGDPIGVRATHTPL